MSEHWIINDALKWKGKIIFCPLNSELWFLMDALYNSSCLSMWSHIWLALINWNVLRMPAEKFWEAKRKACGLQIIFWSLFRMHLSYLSNLTFVVSLKSVFYLGKHKIAVVYLLLICFAAKSIYPFNILESILIYLRFNIKKVFDSLPR